LIRKLYIQSYFNCEDLWGVSMHMWYWWQQLINQKALSSPIAYSCYTECHLLPGVICAVIWSATKHGLLNTVYLCTACFIQVSRKGSNCISVFRLTSQSMFEKSWRERTCMNLEPSDFAYMSLPCGQDIFHVLVSIESQRVTYLQVAQIWPIGHFYYALRYLGIG